MNKKAQSTMTLEELVKMVLGFVMFLMILSFLSILYLSFTSKTPDTFENDFKRVKQDIETLNGGDIDIKVPLFTKGITFWFTNSVNGVLTCPKNEYCLCYNYNSKEKCEKLKLNKFIEEGNKGETITQISGKNNLIISVNKAKIEFSTET